ncbi:hypothetical protein K2173_001346 [Erythroxylum novogranatense]|uniref:CCHC-type domain-containing protein n=1 Tax=Erythroxylum novogranatense TaxID=1862640 RepID=A0AAV8T3F7_9ROSI|nr:hypothetical protein K2173_001346 [Erythroxylum novogranatense]
MDSNEYVLVPPHGEHEIILQFKYGGKFVRKPKLQYVGGKKKIMLVGDEKLNWLELQRIMKEELGVRKYSEKNDEEYHADVEEGGSRLWADAVKNVNQGMERNKGKAKVNKDEAYLIDVPDLTDNEDVELQEVRKKYREILRIREKKKVTASKNPREALEIPVVEAFVSAAENIGTVEESNGIDGEGLYDVRIGYSEGFDCSDDGNETLVVHGRSFNEDNFDDAANLSPVIDSNDSEGEAVKWKRSQTVYFDPTAEDPQFYLGMVFEEKHHIIRALEKHAVKHRRELDYVKNDDVRVRAKCTDPDCSWLFHCSIQKSTKLWKIKTLMAEHKCDIVFSNKRINARVIAENFIRTLGEDLAMSLNKDMVIRRVKNEMGLEISKHQARRGLDKVIRELMPDAEHRFCARHIFAIWRKQHKGDEIHKKFWQCARSTTLADLQDILDSMSGKSKTAIQKTPMHAWCRAYFDTVNVCDAYENNMCEVFNGKMISLRYKAIYTLLEEIRVIVMRRHVERRAYPQKKFKGSFGDRIWPKIVSAGNASGDCHIVAREGDAYEYSLKPVEGDRFWEKAFHGVIDPPELKKINPGRKKNKRVMEEWEGLAGTKLSRKGVRVTCKECAQRGHNSRTCPLKKAKVAKSQENGGAPSETYFSVKEELFVGILG